ncbi:MAG: bifunctional adenosylcobinamide kinase/adenosylcobinamide-phosphate guanylyltransferase [Acidimicrobiales bacterium]
MIVLVLGGARSGKSEMAEGMAADLAAGGPVTVLATAVVEDEDMAARVAIHRARRPAGWATVETGTGLAPALAEPEGVVLVDALGAWVAAAPELVVDAGGLCDALVSRVGHTVVVSEEVGLGVHPSSEAGRRFRDALGLLNQQVAAVAHQVLLVVAGRTLSLDAAPAWPERSSGSPR